MRLALAAALAGLAMPAMAQDGGQPQNRAAAVACFKDPRCAQAVIDSAIGIPDEVLKRIMEANDSSARVRAGIGAPMAPKNRPVRTALGSSEPSIIIEAAARFPTTISFFDRGGKAWPVAADSNGMPAEGGDGFAVKRPVPGGNTVEVAVVGQYPQGKFTVYLEGASKPVSFIVTTGTGSFDDKVVVNVSAYRPGSEPLEAASAVPLDAGDPSMEAMLRGELPAGARNLAISGASPDQVRAWAIGQSLYIRAPYMLMAPQPKRCMSDTDLVRICEVAINTRTGNMGLTFATGAQTAVVWVRTN